MSQPLDTESRAVGRAVAESGATDAGKPVLDPKLLLVGPLLASLPFYPPNAGIMAKVLGSEVLVTVYVGSMLCACLFASAILVIYSRANLTWPGFRNPLLGIIIAAYGLSQTAFWGMAYTGAASTELLMATGILAGLAIGTVMCAWIVAFGHNFRTVLFHGGIACALSTAIIWLASVLPAGPAAALMALCALCGSASLLLIAPARYARYLETRVEPKGIMASMKAFLRLVWLPFLGFLVCCFMMSVFSYDIGGHVTSEHMGSLIAAVLAIGVCYIAGRSSLVAVVSYLVLPISMAICVLLGSFPEGSIPFLVGISTIYGPLFFVVIYALAAATSAVNSGEFPLPLVFGIAFFFAVAAMLGGLALGLEVADVTPQLGTALWTTVVLYAFVVFVSLAIRAYVKIVNPKLHEETAFDADRQSGPPQSDPSFETRLGQLAADHGLSKREREVFELIARGYGSPYIASALFISANTARTHTRNIYRKLGVSSRDEVLQLINE